ncbi:MAG: HAD family phosphatase [Candidatus Latescibacteria bacterium]|nr:HAD family phosphatase [Candidatus Latescibacterota bacterium]
MMTDLVAFDLDGTILDAEGRLAASAAETLEELIVRGIPIASVTGRSILRIQHPFESHPTLARALYLAGYNGSVILGPGEGAEREVLHEERLDEESFAQIVEYGRAEGLNLMYCLFERTDAGIAEEYRHVRPIDHLEALKGPGMVLDVDLYVGRTAQAHAGGRSGAAGAAHRRYQSAVRRSGLYSVGDSRSGGIYASGRE